MVRSYLPKATRPAVVRINGASTVLYGVDLNSLPPTDYRHDFTERLPKFPPTQKQSAISIRGHKSCYTPRAGESNWTPCAGQTEMAEYVQTRHYQTANKHLTPTRIQNFGYLETNPNIGLFSQALRASIGQVPSYRAGIATGSGAIHQTKINKMELALSVAEIDYNNFLQTSAQVTRISRAFFTDNEKRYEVPEKISTTIKLQQKTTL